MVRVPADSPPAAVCRPETAPLTLFSGRGLPANDLEHEVPAQPLAVGEGDPDQRERLEKSGRRVRAEVHWVEAEQPGEVGRDRLREGRLRRGAWWQGCLRNRDQPC